MKPVKIPNPPEPPDFYSSGQPQTAWKGGWTHGFEAGAAGKEELIEVLESCENVFLAWMEDENPHLDLEPGDSASFDAAKIMFDSVRAALKIAKQSNK